MTALTQRSRKNKKSDASRKQLVLMPVDPLTIEEESIRFSLEKKVERAFYEAGKALRELRNRRLYRSTHVTFEEYCRDRFDFTRRRPYQLIEAAQIYDNLIDKCEPIVPVLPTKEGQVRPLSELTIDEQPIAWETAVEQAGGKVPTGRIVKEVVKRMKDNNPKPIPFRVGEICQIMTKDNPELRGKGGCWCIVKDIYKLSCQVSTWNDNYILRAENLKSLGYSTEECQEMAIIRDRMNAIHQTGDLDDAALWVLNGLAKLTAPHLSDLEEKLLQLLELEYKD
ncbi:hypothetical protein [Xenococcus sp. PCC 7305]|uniref:hypothetical protein n=1 Tax=Xenococcus sp. PCC 7305 TaxID=102125 RepID=UPI0005926742|nr:hypothetical protein [Xenococcus sp. PCC 7305]